MKILMHVCCAPCFCYPSRALKKEHELTGYWYNPNIQPYSEYLRRLETLKIFEKLENMHVIYNEEYNIHDWLKKATTVDELDNVKRCEFCYMQRLSKVAKYAKDQNFDTFSTSLLYSPYQKHEIVKELGEKMALKYDIKFYYEDFRDHYKEGQEIAKSLKLYRQKYCGCLFSEFCKINSSNSKLLQTDFMGSEIVNDKRVINHGL
jgi:hypothetical protein